MVICLFLDDHDLLFGIEKIAWPFIISGAWCVFFSLGYGILGKSITANDMPQIKYSKAKISITLDSNRIYENQLIFFVIVFVVMLPFDMPRYYVNDNSISEDEPKESNVIKIRLWKHLLLFTFFYYLISCGIERIYQPMVKNFILFLILIL